MPKRLTEAERFERCNAWIAKERNRNRAEMRQATAGAVRVLAALVAEELGDRIRAGDLNPKNERDIYTAIAEHARSKAGE